MKKITFNKLLPIWFFSTIVLCTLNNFILQSALFHNVVFASLGIVLLIFPVYPESLEREYTPEKCRKIIRIIAIFEILLSFWVKTKY